jgi:hypothetical protein
MAQEIDREAVSQLDQAPLPAYNDLRRLSQLTILSLAFPDLS